MVNKFNFNFNKLDVYDARIESDEELEVAFRYMLVNNLESMEVLITYGYIDQIYQYSNEVDWYQALIAKMRSKKFMEQYIFFFLTAFSFLKIENLKYTLMY